MKRNHTPKHTTKGKAHTKIRCNDCGIWMYVKLVNLFRGTCDTCARTP